MWRSDALRVARCRGGGEREFGDVMFIGEAESRFLSGVRPWVEQDSLVYEMVEWKFS